MWTYNFDSLKEFSKQWNEIKRQWAPFIKTISEFRASYFRFISDFQKSIGPIRQIVAQIKDWIPKNIEVFVQFFELVKEYYGENICKPLASQGWIVTHKTWVSLDSPIELGKIAQSDSVEVTKLMCSLLRKDIVLEEMKERWTSNKYFQRRMLFLEEGLKAHCEPDPNYIVSIPVLLPHIEGIFREFFEDLEYPIDRGAKIEGMVKRLEVPAGFLEIETRASSGVLKKTYISLDEPPANSPHRNAIFHGVDLDYPTEENSAKVIYMLDFICDLTNNPPTGIKPSRKTKDL